MIKMQTLTGKDSGANFCVDPMVLSYTPDLLK